jgi:hypothetical protein
MTPYPDIDVKQLLTELKTRRDTAGKKITDKRIADIVSTTEATISRLRRGAIKETGSARAIAIANYHAQVFRGKA